jgi:hypothetical protein
LLPWNPPTCGLKNPPPAGGAACSQSEKPQLKGQLCRTYLSNITCKHKPSSISGAEFQHINNDQHKQLYDPKGTT